MKKTSFIAALFTVLLVSPFQKTTAQYYFYDNSYYNTPVVFELGGSVGVMNCLTDIGGKPGIGKPFIGDLNIGNTQFNTSVYFGALYKEALGVRLEATFGEIKAYDSILRGEQKTTLGRYERNLSFQSKITEVSLIAELYPLFAFINWEARDQEPPRFSPYLLAGIGYFSFNPQTEYNGKLYDLEPLRTEGQGFKEYPDRKTYSLEQVNYPIGMGLKYELGSNFNLRAEVIYRVLSTDYLDDVSTRYVNKNLFTTANGIPANLINIARKLSDRRDEFAYTNPYPINPNGGQIRGNPKNNDGYFTFNIKLGLVFGRERIR